MIKNCKNLTKNSEFFNKKNNQNIKLCHSFIKQNSITPTTNSDTSYLLKATNSNSTSKKNDKIDEIKPDSQTPVNVSPKISANKVIKHGCLWMATIGT